jgi:hypothetical protein
MVQRFRPANVRLSLLARKRCAQESGAKKVNDNSRSLMNQAGSKYPHSVASLRTAAARACSSRGAVASLRPLQFRMGVQRNDSMALSMT